jgi:hypothetical protein
MIAGESAGVAAALSIQTKTDLQHVNMTQLQALLRSRGQILSASSSQVQGSTQ